MHPDPVDILHSSTSTRPIPRLKENVYLTAVFLEKSMENRFSTTLQICCKRMETTRLSFHVPSRAWDTEVIAAFSGDLALDLGNSRLRLPITSVTGQVMGVVEPVDGSQ